MNTHRYCLLGLPRTGSQYIANLISNVYQGKMIDLVEPFTFSDFLPSIDISNGKIVTCRNKKFNSAFDQFGHVIETINKGSVYQPVILRLFITDGPYGVDLFLPIIINELKKNNFQFLSIKRKNIEQHLLSYAIAITTDKWNTIYDGIHTVGQKYKVTCINDMAQLYRLITSYDNKIKLLDIQYNEINYETATADLNLFKVPINETAIKLKKQIVNDPYDMIENADEIREYIKKLLNVTQEPQI